MCDSSEFSRTEGRFSVPVQIGEPALGQDKQLLFLTLMGHKTLYLEPLTGPSLTIAHSGHYMSIIQRGKEEKGHILRSVGGKDVPHPFFKMGNRMKETFQTGRNSYAFIFLKG